MNVQAAEEESPQQVDVIVKEAVHNDEITKNDESLKLIVEEEQEDTSPEEADGVTVESPVELENQEEIEEEESISLMSLHQDEASLSLGNRSPEIKAFKNDLMAAGFTTWSNPSNYYGSQTAEFVKDFQKAYGLKATGVADQTTLNQLDSLLKSPYQLGENSTEIQNLKIMLTKLGFANWSNPGKHYGRETVQVVKDFQTYYGIVPTGIIDDITNNKINEISNAPMSLGLSRPDVKKFKEDLTAAGFTTWTNPSAYYGSQTAEFVKNFQKYYDLTVDGIADRETIDQLDKVLNGPYQLGKTSPAIGKIKHDLTDLGFTTWTNPGNHYGRETVKFVKDFQKYYNLVPNGIVDEVTLDKINSLIYNSPNLGESSSEILEIKTALMTTGFAPNWTVPTDVYDNETAAAIKEFQAYYGLIENGLIDGRTVDKIKEVANSPYQLGKNSTAIQKIKKDLMNIGFAPDWSDPNGTYGQATVANVTNFQSYYGLKQNGIIDSVTMAKIKSILNSPYQLGKSNSKIRDMKKDLHELGFAPEWTKPTNYFGQDTKIVVENFQRAYKLPVSGIVEDSTLELIKTLQDPGATTNYGISLKQAVDIQMRVSPQTDRNYAYVAANYVDNYNRVTAEALNVRAGAGTNKAIVGNVSKGTTLKVLEKVGDWYRIEYSGTRWVDASRADVEYYLNPRNFVSDHQQKYQFLNLSRLSGATPTELNRFLQGKGVLEGMGAAFIEAGRMYGVNEVYLLSHALLETGHGTSALARGIEVNGVKVYNMFGIGAYDSDPDGFGSKRAYDEGWTTPEQAIIGGAQFIGANYVRAGQNTLYKMRWNPEAMAKYGYATHQYATDMGWAYKQVSSIYNLYQYIGINDIYLDIPIFN